MCFVIMPFAKEFKNQWELAFIPAIEQANLVPWRGDDNSLGTNIIMNDVTKCIYNADIIIADLTGRNPNVMYELGLAHAAKKLVVILSQFDDDVPFDLQHIRYLRYDIRDLSSLKNDLYERINSTISMEKDSHPELFPELKIFNKTDFKELEYLRKRSPVISISVEPDTADIFFNDRLIGNSPLDIRVNTEVERNTISVSAPGCVEYHEDISQEEINKKDIFITLEKRVDGSTEIKRVPRWLRFRRRDPNNPVLMRAIIQYLLSINEIEEALSELNDLLEVTPDWYLAHNQAGYVKKRINIDEGMSHFQKVVALNSRNYVGFYNLACCYSIKKEYKMCLSYLEKIFNNKYLLSSFSKVKSNMLEDTDFDNIKNAEDFSADFIYISGKLMLSRKT